MPDIVAASWPRFAGHIDPVTGRYYSDPGRVPSEPVGEAAGWLEYYGLTPDRYVAADATGLDNGLTENAPWTWEQYLANASNGQIIGLLPGVYVGSNTGERYVPSFNPVAGTTLVARYAAAYHDDDRSEFRNGVTSGSGCPTIGAYQRNNVKWYGAYVNENVARSGGDTGLATQWASNNCEFHGLRLECIEIDRNDNHNAFRIEQAQGCLIKNSVLTGCRRSSQADQNHAAIMVYDGRDVVITHCEFAENDVDYFPKGDHGSGTGYPPLVEHEFAYNICVGARRNAIHIGGLGERSGDWDLSLFHHNLILGVLGAAIYAHAFSNGTPRGIDVFNNTFDGCSNVFYVGHTGSPLVPGRVHLYGNLYTNNGRVIDSSELGTSDLSTMIGHGMYSDGNHAHGNGTYATISGVGNRTVSQLRTTTSGLGSEWDTSTTEGDPLYVDRSGGDFRLQGGSPAAGKGAYVGEEVPGLET